MHRRMGQWIRLPPQVEADRQKVKFFRMRGFPNVVGCVDGTHIRIEDPPSWDGQEQYFVNRKRYHSLNVQVRVRHCLSNKYLLETTVSYVLCHMACVHVLFVDLQRICHMLLCDSLSFMCITLVTHTYVCMYIICVCVCVFASMSVCVDGKCTMKIRD
eukprot:TRINITY_DN404_c0_g2_i2.p1 TRINITY_DN404_c0_g2~~TRINITY_DN404_c0_g2_i2.p1  ORF type:complete len:158 (+),score=15.89 TRINITY_DN404_c0_g2_i2:794-1267(+)